MPVILVVLVIAAAWLLASVSLALLVGGAVRLRDEGWPR
jgi:hypothetical protein